MTWALAFAIGGALALKAAIENASIGDVLRGVFQRGALGPGERGFRTDLLVSAIATTGQAAGGERGKGGGAVGSTSGRGKAILAPGADRAGVSTKAAVLRAVEKISAVFGEPLTITTGTQHSQYTTTGGVSQHWTGDAADIAMTGDRLTRLGRAALVAGGMSEGEAQRASGGIYNLPNGWQVIFNTTEGGNHWNHLHVGL